MWGQGGFLLDWDSSLRIIPTRVGTRTYFFDVSFNARDHPHACGDKEPIGMYIGLRSGSSPRVWGQGCCQYLSQACPRDHPHACGDKCTKSAAQILQLGSSPRVWGQVENPIPQEICFRIIPTRVGTRK